MIRILRSLLQRRRRRMRAERLSWGGCPGALGGAPLPPPDALLCPPGHEVVELGIVMVDFDGERIEATACKTRPLGATAGR